LHEKEQSYVLLLWFVHFTKMTNPESKVCIEPRVWDASRDTLTLFVCACSNCPLCEAKRNSAF
jgi:hypothetical protein